MTKHLHDEALKDHLTIEEEIEVTPKVIDNSVDIVAPHMTCKPKNKMKVRMVKSKVPVKRTSRLEKATEQLYDLEESHGPEKPLNIDFGLYKMEDY